MTSCGHRFCKACITSWLRWVFHVPISNPSSGIPISSQFSSRKDESRCPIDNKLLNSDSDIFADNFTKRQIDQLLKPCRNSSAGCTKTFAPGELENHLLVCEFGANGGERFACTFNYCGCEFKGATKEELDDHLKDDLNQHLEVEENGN